MATLRYSQVRAHPGGTIRYIANKDKIISDRVHDVHNVLAYMGEPESTERIYSFGRHCSTNPDLAEKQIALHRARYYDSKNGGVQGLQEGKEELLGLHFFQSYTEADDPSEEVMNDIAMKIAEHPLFRDFAVFGANHFDKKHKHSHFFVSQFSAEGKPHKLCMRHEDFNDIRRYANRLCVEHGLSIIDLAVLRKDPEYSDWLDSVIDAGKVIVHPEKVEHKRHPKQKVPTRNIYYKWMKDKEEREATEERMLTPRKKFAKNYFYTVDGKNVHYVTGDPKNRFYAIPVRSKEGWMRTRLELTVMYVTTIARQEGRYIKAQDPELWLRYNAKVDWKLQNMADCLRTANEMNIADAKEVPTRIADVGKQMNALKREKSRHENSIKKHEQIFEAFSTYNRIRPLVEGVPEPKQESMDEYKASYAILVRNQILTAEAYAELRRRYEFEKRKINDYEKRMPELKRQYRDLKKLEAVTNRPAAIVDEIFDYSERASCPRESTIDDIIERSKERAQATGNNGRRRDIEREY